MTGRRAAIGFTIIDLMVVMLVIMILVAAVVPVVAGAGGNAGIQQSMSNLVAQSAAHLMYAGDWNGRQVPHNPDDSGFYGGATGAYHAPHTCLDVFAPHCPPPVLAGLSGKKPWNRSGHQPGA